MPATNPLEIGREKLGKSELSVCRIGLGCMSMSGTYGPSDDGESIKVIHHALDRGMNFLDSSDMYGWGHNETLLGKAIGYAVGQWPKLIRYLEHPAMTPDTNAVENAIRPFVIGRKNWLFSGSPRGATASATLFSIIETARANGKEPYWYLRESTNSLQPTRRPTSSASLRFGSRNPNRVRGGVHHSVTPKFETAGRSGG